MPQPMHVMEFSISGRNTDFSLGVWLNLPSPREFNKKKLATSKVMAGTQKKLGFFVQDLKTSWYFRIWVVLWLICFITWLVSLGVFAHRASDGVKQKAWRTFVKDQSENGFAWPIPTFELSWHEINSTLQIIPSTISCQFLDSGQPLGLSECTHNGKPANACFVVNTAKLIAKPSKALGVSWIQCSFNTTGWSQGNDNLVRMRVTDGIYNTAYIAPNQEAWVILNRREFKFEGQSSFSTGWETQTIYQSSLFIPNSYNVALVINNFLTFYVEQYEFYTGLMSASDLGGFAFFLSLLLTTVMILVGLVLENDSTFLKS